MGSKRSKHRRRESAAGGHEATWSAEEYVVRTSRWTSNKTLYSLIAITVIAIAFGIWRSQQGAATPEAPRQEPLVRSGALVARTAFHDFGTISMAAGNVSHRYRISNTGAQPLTINRIFTSCMCTLATLTISSGRKYGPFGMLGHGFSPTIESVLAPGQDAHVEIVFDPAAHGPAGIGRTERTITIGSTQAQPLELRFVAMVRP